MDQLIDRKRHGYVATDAVTSFANLIDKRPFMLRLAFRDGLLSKRTYAVAPAAVEATSIVSLIATVAAVGIEAVGAHEVKPERIIGYACGGVLMAGAYFISSQFKKKTEAEAAKIEHYFKKEYEAVCTILGQGYVWKESDAHVLGRSISYLSYYLKRNTRALRSHANFQHIVERREMPDLDDKIMMSARQRIGQLQEASDVTKVEDLRDDVVRAYSLLRLCVGMALDEGVMRTSDNMGRYCMQSQLRPIDHSMRKLGLLNVSEKLFNAEDAERRLDRQYISSCLLGFEEPTQPA